jgi:hypothetical protein
MSEHSFCGGDKKYGRFGIVTCCGGSFLGAKVQCEACYQKDLKATRKEIISLGEVLKQVDTPLPVQDFSVEHRIVQELKSMPVDTRMSIINNFCKHCGSDDPKCQCWNDE